MIPRVCKMTLVNHLLSIWCISWIARPIRRMVSCASLKIKRSWVWFLEVGGSLLPLPDTEERFLICESFRLSPHLLSSILLWLESRRALTTHFYWFLLPIRHLLQPRATKGNISAAFNPKLTHLLQTIPARNMPGDHPPWYQNIINSFKLIFGRAVRFFLIGTSVQDDVGVTK